MMAAAVDALTVLARAVALVAILAGPPVAMIAAGWSRED